MTAGGRSAGLKVVVFGATGMVGQGVLAECLAAADVAQVATVGRSRSGQVDPKLRELVAADPGDLRALEAELTGLDACFWCLGVSAAGLSEAEYARLNYEMTLAAARTLVRLDPQMTFVYVSGAGTDATEAGRTMWARVKGRTENALQRLGFKAVYLFRPGVIEPLDGIRSKTPAYRWFYVAAVPFWPLLRLLLGDRVLTTAEVGRAMLEAARSGAGNVVLEAAQIKALARSVSGLANTHLAT
jgi:uncharacterized protein YbjT (DUF2867 family)